MHHKKREKHVNRIQTIFDQAMIQSGVTVPLYASKELAEAIVNAIEDGTGDKTEEK